QDFHQTVSSSAQNPTMASMLRGISSGTLRARAWRGILEGDAGMRTIAEHEAIYAALAAGDGALARAAALVHVATTESFLRRVLASVERTAMVHRDGRRRAEVSVP